VDARDLEESSDRRGGVACFEPGEDQPGRIPFGRV